MNKLLRRLARHPTTTVGLLFASLAANLLALVPAVFVILVLNRYVTYGVDATLATLASAAVVAIAFEYIFRRLRYQTASRLDDDADKNLNDKIFIKAAQAKLGYIDQVPVSTLKGVFGSVEQFKNAYSAANICTFFDAPFALLFLVVLYLICPPISYLTAGFIAVLSLITTLQLLGLREVGKNINRAGTLKSQIGNNVIDAPETVRVFDLEARLVDKWRKVCSALEALQYRLFDRQDRIQSLIRAFTGLLTVSVISLGAVLVVDGELDVGAMIGANILAARALTPVVSLCQQVEGWARAEQAHQTITDFQRLPMEKSDGTTFEQYSGKIEFREVSFTYPGRETPVIERLDFSVGPGEVVCVSGGNGAGKSTLAKLIIGLFEPGSGYVSIDGVNLKQASMNWWRKQVIYLPQEPRFQEGSIRDNFLAVKDDLNDNDIRKLLADVGLNEIIDKTVGGLEQVISEAGTSLSLGVRRRLALARALVHGGRLVVLDEPTEGIDADGASSVYSVMNELSSSGRTLIVCSHDKEIVSGAHHTIDLDDGAKAVMRTLEN